MLADPYFHATVDDASAIISKALKRGGKILICGNGGSAADAQHMAAEFVGKYLKVRKGLPALALSVNTSALTAIGNDYGYEHVFSRQVEALASKDDVIIGISTSGNSSNVVYALDLARSKGCSTIALTGSQKCRMDTAADIVIKVPSESTPRIQELHIFVIHTICELVENGIE
jgi:D-sedoheptulose 7-phosphate isomerase